MNKLIITLLIVLAAVPTFSQGRTSPEEAVVLSVVKKWNQAFEENDPETYFEFIHDDITLFIPGNPYRVDGKMKDREEFEWSLRKERTRVSLFQELQPRVQLLNASTAIVTYYSRGAYGPEGKEQMSYLKETDVMTKENNQWKVIHIHVSN